MASEALRVSIHNSIAFAYGYSAEIEDGITAVASGPRKVIVSCVAVVGVAK